MKIPHGQGVVKALRSVRAATKKALDGLNRVAAQRMAKGDYTGAEALAAKGREIRQFQQQYDELVRAWREVSGRGSKDGKDVHGETTPLWAYYQPILKAIVDAGGECRRVDVEAAFRRSADGLLQPGDFRPMMGGRERWQVMIRRARKALRTEGWIEDTPGTIWRITRSGREAAARQVNRRQ